MFYIITIITVTFVIACIGSYVSPYYNYSSLYALLISIILTISVILIDGLFAFIIRRLPEKYFNEKHKKFDAKKSEIRFYEKIGIKEWKDKVLELGGFTSFHKDEIRKPNDEEYIKRFILECNYGSLIHFVCVLVGFLVIFITPLEICYIFAIPVAIANAFLNLLPMFILRYNVPRLKRLLLINQRINKEK